MKVCVLPIVWIAHLVVVRQLLCFVTIRDVGSVDAVISAFS